MCLYDIFAGTSQKVPLHIQHGMSLAHMAVIKLVTTTPRFLIDRSGYLNHKFTQSLELVKNGHHFHGRHHKVKVALHQSRVAVQDRVQVRVVGHGHIHSPKGE
jgi:hypothetical protein